MSNKIERLELPEGSYSTQLSAKYKNREPWHAKDPRQVMSFIPGTIMSVDVQVGDTVAEGDVLLTFKAMKMHNTYRSPISGRVARVCVREGEVVPKGVLLVEFE